MVKKMILRPALLLMTLTLLAGCIRTGPQGGDENGQEPVTWRDPSAGSGEADQGEISADDLPAALRKINEEYTIAAVFAISDERILAWNTTEDKWLILDSDTGELLHLLELNTSDEARVQVFSDGFAICDRMDVHIIREEATSVETIEVDKELAVTGEGIFSYCVYPDANLIYFSMIEEEGQETVLCVLDRDTGEQREILRLGSPEHNTGYLNGFYGLGASRDGGRIYFTGYYFVQGEQESYPCYGYVETESGETMVVQGGRGELQVLPEGCLFYDGLAGYGEKASGEIAVFHDDQEEARVLELERPEDSQWVIPGTEQRYFYSIVTDDMDTSTQISQYEWETGERRQVYSLPYYVQQAAFTGQYAFLTYARWDEDAEGWNWIFDCLRLDEGQENPFDLEAMEEEGQEVTAAYGLGLVDGNGVSRAEQTIDYQGGELRLRFLLDNQGGDCQVGLLVFVDGVAQRCHLKDGEETYMVTCGLTGIGITYVDVYLTPEFGWAGEEHYLSFAGMLNPSYVPDTNTHGYGNNHRTLPNLPYRIEYPVETVQLEMMEAEEPEEYIEESNGIHAAYLQGGQSMDYLEMTDGRAEFEIALTCRGVAQEQYRMSLWVNGAPVPAFDGAYYADVLVGEGGRTVVGVELTEEMTRWAERNAMDVILVPLTNQDSAYGPLIESVRPITVAHAED